MTLDEKTHKGLINKFKHEMNKVKGTHKLVEFIEYTGFFEYPAALRHHGNFEGGLLAHSIAVYLLFTQRVKDLKVTLKDRTSIIAPLLHDVCKLSEYCYSEPSQKYKWNKKPFDNTHGTKSIKIIEKLFELTSTEKALIKYHMGVFKTEIYVKYGHPEYTLKEYEKIINEHPITLAFHNCDNEASKFIC